MDTDRQTSHPQVFPGGSRVGFERAILAYGGPMTEKSHKNRSPDSPSGRRGPAEHERREQIVSAANEHFRRYGYNKTTVADLARAIGLSTAYIYKFFDSKQAIGEAACAESLGGIVAELKKIVGQKKAAAGRLRAM
jgi:hypothetical protein